MACFGYFCIMFGKINTRSLIHTVPMFRYAIFIIIGIVLGDFFADDVDVRMWLFVLGLLVAGGIVMEKKHPQVCSVMILLAIAAVGAFRLSLSELGRFVFEEPWSGVETRMVVVTEPVVRGKVLQFEGLAYDVRDVEAANGTRMRISVLRDTITKRYEGIHIGDGIAAKIDVTPLENWHRLDSHFDYMRWLRVRNISCRAFVPIGKWEKEEWRKEDIGTFETMKLKALVFRQKILERIEWTGMEHDAFAVATAMALGNKAELTTELKEEYSISGVSHVLALSGVHLTIIYILLTLFVGKRRIAGSAVLIVLIWGYVLLTGMPISLVRAAGMLTIWEVLQMVDKRQKSLNVLGFTACVMVMVNPQNVWDVGFQMSFASVLAIISLKGAFMDIMPEKWKYKNKKERKRQTKTEHRMYGALRKGWMTVAISLSAQVGVMPLSAYYFGRIPLLFVATNLVVMFVISPIVGLTMLMALLCAVDVLMDLPGGGATYWLGAVLNWMVGKLNAVLGWIAGLPFASVEGVDVGLGMLVLVYALIIAGVVYANRRRLRGVL